MENTEKYITVTFDEDGTPTLEAFGFESPNEAVKKSCRQAAEEIEQAIGLTVDKRTMKNLVAPQQQKATNNNKNTVKAGG